MSTSNVDAALTSILSSSGSDREVSLILGMLSPTEKELFIDLLDKVHTGEIDDASFDDIWKVDYTRQPPDMATFLDDEYWIGNRTLPTEENEGIYPSWKKILTRDFDLDSQIHNTVITGSLGTGKSFSACIIILYRLTCARLLRSPETFFGLSRGSDIYYSILSITKAAVRETVFGDALEFMGQSPFFREVCNFKPDRIYSDNLVDLGNHIWINAGSKGWHVIGKNMMGILLDEGNFRLEKNPNLKAYALYNSVRTRIQNRFQRFSGFLPAISILASSSADESSFTEKVKKEIQAINDPLRQTVYQNSVYDIKSHVLKLSPRRFKVSYGLRTEDPRVLDGLYDVQGNPIDGTGPHTLPSHGASIELVPEDYLEGFRRDPKQSLQDISGISVGGSHKLFSSVLCIDQCIELAEADGVKNPCKLQAIPLSLEDDKELHEFLDHDVFLTRRMGSYCPIRHPYAVRFAHVDLASATMAGVSIGHIVGQTEIERYEKGKSFKSYQIIFEYDMILTIVAGSKGPISLGKVQNFFFWLRDMAGFRFGLVTEDQWQSEQSLQTMMANGFNVGRLSMDRKKTQYIEWRTAFQELRLRPYRQLQMIHEASELLDLPDKIDHPESGSKDTADSAGGAYFNAIYYLAKEGDVGRNDYGIPTISFTKDGDGQQDPAPISIPITLPTQRPNSYFEA